MSAADLHTINLGTATPNLSKTSIDWYSCRFKNRFCCFNGPAPAAVRRANKPPMRSVDKAILPGALLYYFALTTYRFGTTSIRRCLRKGRRTASTWARFGVVVT